MDSPFDKNTIYPPLSDIYAQYGDQWKNCSRNSFGSFCHFWGGSNYFNALRPSTLLFSSRAFNSATISGCLK
jgi:hypothetical protein